MSIAAEPMPFFTVTHDSGVAVASEDRRSAVRQRNKLPARIQVLGGADVLDGTTDDISEGGLRLCTRVKAGIGVGQRCEVTLLPDHGSLRCLETVYATIVRTERVGDESEPLLGIGLRFDQPLYL